MNTYSIDADMQKFIQDPAKFQISSRDQHLAENGEYYKMKKEQDWIIEFEGGYAGIGCFYDDGTLFVFSYKAEPPGLGYGSRGIRVLEQLMEPLHVNIEVIDQEDEAREFWEKMGY
jgi:hypothetical protein